VSLSNLDAFSRIKLSIPSLFSTPRKVIPNGTLISLSLPLTHGEQTFQRSPRCGGKNPIYDNQRKSHGKWGKMRIFQVKTVVRSSHPTSAGGLVREGRIKIPVGGKVQEFRVLSTPRIGIRSSHGSSHLFSIPSKSWAKDTLLNGFERPEPHVLFIGGQPHLFFGCNGLAFRHDRCTGETPYMCDQERPFSDERKSR
jgi:hypothetical protein